LTGFNCLQAKVKTFSLHRGRIKEIQRKMYENEVSLGANKGVSPEDVLAVKTANGKLKDDMESLKKSAPDAKLLQKTVVEDIAAKLPTLSAYYNRMDEVEKQIVTNERKLWSNK